MQTDRRKFWINNPQRGGRRGWITRLRTPAEKAALTRGKVHPETYANDQAAAALIGCEVAV